MKKMKNLVLHLMMLFSGTSLFAQWVPVPIGTSSSAVTSIFAYADTVMAGTDGDGIFKTLDQGANWTNISGNIGNTSINDIRGGGGPKVIWAATDNGAYFTQDHTTYLNCASSGLSTSEITYFWFGDGSETAEWAIGTNGGGVYIAAEMNGPWNYSSNGLTGNGLIINDLSGYDDDEEGYAVVATNNGVYFSFDSLTNWTSGNNGLSGDQLIVKRLACLGTAVIIATHGGCYYTADFGDTWMPLLPDEKFNTLLLFPTLTGLSFFILGEAGYYSTDFTNFYAIDLSGIQGEIISVASTSIHLFVGTGDPEINSKSGGVYRLPLDQLITAISNPVAFKQIFPVLDQNYPNPFSSLTTIHYEVFQSGQISLKVFDYTGREVHTLVNDYQAKGRYSIDFRPENLSQGIYYYTLQTEGYEPISRKLIINR
jgi:hypothetical protein